MIGAIKSNAGVQGCPAKIFAGKANLARLFVGKASLALQAFFQISHSL